MKKIATFLFLLVVVLGGFSSPALAADACGAQFNVSTASNFYDDSRVTIDINDFSGDNDRQVAVTPKAGYAIVSLELDWTGSDAADISVTVEPNTITYNAPNNQDIDNVYVVVKKTCPDVCPNIAGEQYTVPSGMVLTAGQCVVPPPVIVDVCPNIAGDQTIVPEGYEILLGSCVPINVPPPVCPQGTIGIFPLCVPVVDPPLECPVGEHVEGEICVTDEVTPEEPPVEEPAPAVAQTQSSGGGLGVSYFVWCDEDTYDKPKVWPYCAERPVVTTPTTTAPETFVSDETTNGEDTTLIGLYLQLRAALEKIAYELDGR